MIARIFGASRRQRVLRGSTALAASFVGLAALVAPMTTRAATPVLPQGGTVVVGAATIRSNIPGSLDVTTATDRTAINWQSFSIGAGNTVTINQPNASSLTLNQVVGADPSSIFGVLKSNGQVVLANPNGIWFGPGSHVDVASIVASTATASQAALNAFARGGALMLDKAGKANASIVNDGAISIGQEGLAGLVAPGVANNGIIAARLGRVVLASGTVATLDFYGDGLISFAVGGSVTAHAKDQAGKNLSAAVVNSGTISNAGGTVLMTAAAAKTVVDNTINMSGVVIASAVSSKGGEIDLDGGSGTTSVSGELLASSKTAGGGTINVTGHSVVLAPTARLDVTGAAGGSVAVGGGMHGAGKLAHATDVTLTKGSTIAADGTKGAGGSVAVWSDGVTKAGAAITATGTTTGGAVETSGHYLDIAGVSVKAGSWLLDPFELDIDVAAATGINAALNNDTGVTLVTTAASSSGGFGTANANGTDSVGGDIVIQAPITWTTTATLNLNANHSIVIDAPINAAASGSLILATANGGAISYDAPVSFAGRSAALTINGINYILVSTATELQAITTLTAAYALAADIDASGIANFNPIGLTVVGASPVRTPFTGILDGLGHSVDSLTISNSTGSYLGLISEIGSGGRVLDLHLTNATVNAGSTTLYAGLLAGFSAGSISNVSATGTVLGGGAAFGGLVGSLQPGGTIAQSWADATVLGFNNVGALVGEIYGGEVVDSYALGSVSAGDTVGGLVGYDHIGTIQDSFATVVVNGNTNAGGLIGVVVAGGAVTDSYWSTDVSGKSTSPAGTATLLTDLEAALPVGFSDGAWSSVPNQTTPFLVSNAGLVNLFGAGGRAYHVIANASELAAVSAAANYVLVGDIDLAGISNFAPLTLDGFSGDFNGLGHSISNLTINDGSSSYVALFAVIGATGSVENLTLRNFNLTTTVGANFRFLAALVGDNSGTINAVHVIGGSLFGAATVNPDSIGGLAGANEPGSFVTASSVTGMSIGMGGAGVAGGLVGDSFGHITDSSASVTIEGAGDLGGLVGFNDSVGVITRSYATGPVIVNSDGTTTTFAGGFVGEQDGTVADSYATGTVSVVADPNLDTDALGGFAGIFAFNVTTAVISTSFSTGDVTATGSRTGGFLGLNWSGGSVTDSYWVTDLSSQTSSAAGTGILLADLEAAMPANFVPGVWDNGGNGSTPYLVGTPGPVYVNGGGRVLYTAVTSAADLATLSATGDYALEANIDLSGVTNFIPIGFNSSGGNAAPTLFEGIFDGLGHSITGFSISSASADNLGLFSAIGTNGMVENLVISAATITTTGTGDVSIGLLAGENQGQIVNVAVSGTISAPGLGSGANVGGLSGLNAGGVISASSASVTITADGNVGGLVGTSNAGRVSASSAAGDVTEVTGRIGGLVGYNYNGATIADSFATGAVSATGSNATIGGLVGANGFEGAVNAYTSALAAGTITGSHATGVVTLFADTSFVGGLVGYNISVIDSSYATGAVLGIGDVGGLVGHNSNVFFQYVGTITNSYATGAVTSGSGTSPLNGFAPSAGGLVGFNEGFVIRSLATGAVTASFNGGAVEDAGGLVGENFADSISDSYATGAVFANGNAGGLIGKNEAAVVNSFAVGAVSGVGTVGGLIAVTSNGGAVTNGYWVTDTTGQSSSAGGTAITAAQLTSGTLPAGFSGSTWVVAADSLPYLAFQTGSVVLPPVFTGSLTVAGIVYLGYGSTSVLQNGSVDIVFDGLERTATVSNGAYSAVFSGSAAARNEIVIVLTGGASGSAFYDTTRQAFTGLNVYAGSVLLSTDGGSVATAMGNLSNEIAHLTTGAGLDGLTLSQSGVSIASGLGLVIDAAGTAGSSLALDIGMSSHADPLSTLVLSGMASIVEGGDAIHAARVGVDDGGSVILTNTANEIGTIAGATTNSRIGNLLIDDLQPLTLGTLTVDGVLEVGTDAVATSAGAAVHAGAGILVDTLNGGDPIGIGTASGILALSSPVLAVLGASSNVTVGDGSNTITTAGVIAGPGGLTLAGNVVLASDTELDTSNPGAGIVFTGTVTPANPALGLTLNAAGDVYFGGSVGTSSSRLDSLTVAHAAAVTVAQGSNNATLWVDNFATGGDARNFGITGLLSVGQHSLESDGDVAIFATAVDGRIVAGNNVSITADTIANANVTAGNNIQVAAVNVSDSSFTATRSANITVTDGLTGSTVTAGVANISAGSYRGDRFNSPNLPNLQGGDPTVGGNIYNGQPVTQTVTQLASLTVPTNATNPKVQSGSGQSAASDDDDEGSSGDGGSGKKKEKGAKGGRNGVEKARDDHNRVPARTYDAANQFLNKLLSTRRSAAGP